MKRSKRIFLILWTCSLLPLLGCGGEEPDAFWAAAERAEAEGIGAEVFMNLKSEYGTLNGLASALAAWGVRYTLHEVGHMAMAQQLGAQGARIQLGGEGIDPLSYAYDSAPLGTKLPIAAAGLEMDDILFEWAFSSYKQAPTKFNKALMFFSNFNALLYSVSSTLLESDNPYFDPNAIRQETGMSKSAIIAAAAAKTLVNLYKIEHPDDPWAPTARVFVDPHMMGVGLMFTWKF